MEGSLFRGLHLPAALNLFKKPRASRFQYTIIFVFLVVVVIAAYISYTIIFPFSSINISLFPGFSSSIASTQDGSLSNLLFASKEHSPILLVSAFFPLSHSKHSLYAYKTWLTHFLSRIHTPIYMFTTPELAPTILALRGAGSLLIVNTSYETPFDIPPLTRLGMRQRYEEMWAWDREKNRHGPDLYAVWTAKPYFLDEGLKNTQAVTGMQYEYAFWVDAGSFREQHMYVDWPGVERVREVWGDIKSQHNKASSAEGYEEDEMIFFPMWLPPSPDMRNWQESMGPVDAEFSEGSFFGGTPKSIAWWRKAYFTYHDWYLSQDIFVGKDQTLINALFLMFPENVGTVWLLDPTLPSSATSWTPALDTEGEDEEAIKWDPQDGRCGNPFYYYQWWLASSSEQDAMNLAWDTSLSSSRWWWTVLWWMLGRETASNLQTEEKLQNDMGLRGRGCQLARPFLMERLLRQDSIFGSQWKAPSRMKLLDSDGI